MTRRRFEISGLSIGGVPGVTIKIATDTTADFIEHMRSHYQSSFTVVYAAGMDADWDFDSCSGAGSDFAKAVHSFRPPGL